MIRLNATEIEAKSSDPRTSLTASARAIASTTSSLPGGEHGFHHVISEAAHVAQIELQALAHEVGDRLFEIHLRIEAPLRLRADVLRARIGEQLC